MPTIAYLKARWILDSRGFPTVSATMVLDYEGRKFSGSAAVPSGASTGTHEALELRDGEKEFNGKGVNKAVWNVNNTIVEAIRFKEFNSAPEVDDFLIKLDGTENKSGLGANAILAVSMAAHRAFAEVYSLQLWQYLRRIYFSFLPAKQFYPRLMLNILNGGQHADNPIDIQEFMIVPKTNDIIDSIMIGTSVYHTLKKALKKDGHSTGVGDEGGLAPHLETTEAALEYVDNSINLSGYSRDSIDIALDAAASEFFSGEDSIYSIDGKKLNFVELTDFYELLHQRFNILSIEDAMAEDNVLGWKEITQRLGNDMMLVGDDLFVTNSQRFMQLGYEQGVANSILIKLNQIGTVKETCLLINQAKEKGYRTIVSHRSGETTDDFISDLAYSSQADFLKAGAPARGERTAKYNRLLEIRESLVE